MQLGPAERDGALDEIGLVGAGGIDRRSCAGGGFLGTRDGIVGATEKGAEDSHGELQGRSVDGRVGLGCFGPESYVVAADLSASNFVGGNTSHFEEWNTGRGVDESVAQGIRGDAQVVARLISRYGEVG